MAKMQWQTEEMVRRQLEVSGILKSSIGPRIQNIKFTLGPLLAGEPGWTFDCLQNSFAFARPGKQVFVSQTSSLLTEKQDNQYHLRLRRYQTTHGW